MIIVFSESKDYSTLEVIRWLKVMNKKYIRINSDEPVKLVKLDLISNEITLEVNNIEINLSEISCYWYRRGYLNFRRERENERFPEFFSKENTALNYFIFDYLWKNKKGIGNYLYSVVNKLAVLKLASEVGLKIPNTYATGSKDIAAQLLSQNRFITKGLDTAFWARENSYYSMAYTSEVQISDLSQFENSFYPSLLQERIEKTIEIRSFFLSDTFYSMAILSQNNPKTKEDFRNYDTDLPNRTVPYKLPVEVELKLLMLMQRLHLNTSSIDLVLNKNGEYIFLEVNPIGQFGMVSKPCNYQLERLIAKKLSDYAKDKHPTKYFVRNKNCSKENRSKNSDKGLRK